MEIVEHLPDKEAVRGMWVATRLQKRQRQASSMTFPPLEAAAHRSGDRCWGREDLLTLLR